MKNRILIFSAITIFLYSCNYDPYQPGSGIGDIGYSDETQHKWKEAYLRKYLDTLLTHFPQYKIPDSINPYMISHGPGKNQTDTIYRFEHLPYTDTLIYFGTYPREIYDLQLGGGTGFSIRMGYNIEDGKEILENHRQGAYVSDSARNRIKDRFLKEIYLKLDSLISHSPDSSSALYHRPDLK